MQLRALEREAKAQRDLFESYLAKYREASARDNIGAASPDARIISRAVVSTTPAYPKTLATVLVAALGTLVLSVGWILSGELLSAASGVPAPAPVRRESVSAVAESPAEGVEPALPMVAAEPEPALPRLAATPPSRSRATRSKPAKPRRVQRMFALEEDLDKKLWLYAIHVGKDRSDVVNDLLRPVVASMVLYDSRDRRSGR